MLLLSWVLPGYGHALVDNDGAFDATTYVPDDLEAALLPLLRTMIDLQQINYIIRVAKMCQLASLDSSG